VKEEFELTEETKKILKKTEIEQRFLILEIRLQKLIHYFERLLSIVEEMLRRMKE